MIVIKSHKCSIEKLHRDYPEAVIIDVTSLAKDEFVKLSPFYPHGGIPVPFSPGWKATCVEAVWQGLKDFESVGTDYKLFRNDTMKNLKRTVRRFGTIKGHRKGVGSPILLNYVEARKILYLPTYKWVLENKAWNEVLKIRKFSRDHMVILLDFSTNSAVEDTSKPLSHAALIKAYIEGNYPSCEGAYATEKERKEELTTSFRIGQVVKHPTFGKGTVLSTEGERIRVDFEEVGEKLLSLRFVKLEISFQNL